MTKEVKDTEIKHNTYSENQKHNILNNIKLFLECNLMSGQFNQHLARQGISVIVDPALMPNGLLVIPAQNAAEQVAAHQAKNEAATPTQVDPALAESSDNQKDE